ncbi:MAG TPA: hypothetical protein VFW19_06955 [Allosphingosinicella sp.]|nr:hypothetical protein [Allosphingosinicella sp.]
MKTLILTASLVLGIAAIPVAASAQDYPPCGHGVTDKCTQTHEGMGGHAMMGHHHMRHHMRHHGHMKHHMKHHMRHHGHHHGGHHGHHHHAAKKKG